MESLTAFLPVISAVAIVCGISAVASVLWLHRRFERFARPYEELARNAAQEGPAAALQAQLLGVERNAQRIDATMAFAEQIRTQLNTALQGIGFLKYDAFEDIRGQQSYSLCLLDAHQNGVILTSIAGRNDYRGYAKPVKAGTCELALSEEEKEALAMAKSRFATPDTTAPAATAPAAAAAPAELAAKA